MLQICVKVGIPITGDDIPGDRAGHKGLPAHYVRDAYRKCSWREGGGGMRSSKSLGRASNISLLTFQKYRGE